MSRTSRRVGTKTQKAQRAAYQAWHAQSGLRDVVELRNVQVKEKVAAATPTKRKGA